MSGTELQPGETAVAFYLRLRGDVPWDPTGAARFANACSIAALAVADRNEPIQRALLEQLQDLNRKLDLILPFATPPPAVNKPSEIPGL